MIKILKASAGSGKTYRLANEYIKILLASQDDFAYRHILAVTFTNKATDEMKDRILKHLSLIAKGEIKKLGDKEISKDEVAKAGRILSNILHDYSAFAVSTIDKFFQHTLRAFAKEIGHYSLYQVELNKDMLVEEAVDKILDGLDSNAPEDSQLIEYILENMEQKAMDGRAPQIEKDLKEMAIRLKSENFRVKADRIGLNLREDYATDRLKALKKACTSLVSEFEEQAVSRAKDIVRRAGEAGLQPDDFAGGQKSSWLNFFVKLSSENHGKKLVMPSEPQMRKISDQDLWFPANRADLLPRAKQAIGQAIDDFLKFWDAGLKAYCTAWQIKNNLYGLGIAERLTEVFNEIEKERNVVCLDESTFLLRDIIDGSDAPFIYEKTGVRFEHFLLDEFQDTSNTQWENFLPLLKESESWNDRHNLVVGDVKQCIYRWRDSDWSLLDSRLQKEFPNAQVEALNNNFRSDENIIAFNNSFYKDVASILDEGRSEGLDFRKISGIYNDVHQDPGKTEYRGKGGVEAKFCDDTESELGIIVDAIKKAHDEDGIKYGDIAVLVRKNDNGTDVANALIENDIPIVTEAALCIKNSLSVRRIVSLMSYVSNPEDGLNAFLSGELEVEMVNKSFHSLIGLCEELYLLLAANPKYLQDLANDTVYINAFVDYVMDFANNYGNNLKDFLKFWEDQKPSISTPMGTDAVRIVTIHKSKGLAFPYVIVPFIEDIELYHTPTTEWCQPEDCNLLPQEAKNKLFMVSLSSTSENTAFNRDYQSELYNQSVDAMNMMYVATTRPEHGLLLIGLHKEVKKETNPLSNFSKILYRWCGEADYKSGDGFSCRREPSDGKSKQDSSDNYQLSYEVIPTGARLGVRPYAEEFFTTDSNGLDAMSFRRRGIVLHDILSRVVYKDDLEASVEAAAEDGSICEADKENVLSMLSKAVASRPEYFPSRDSGVKILTESSIIGRDGQESRPDRVLIYPDGRVEIIDYKFGAYYSEYENQLERYKSLFEAMGYKSVKAELWFVNKNV